MEILTNQHRKGVDAQQFRRRGEMEFERLLELDQLDHQVDACPALAYSFEELLAVALDSAYGSETGDEEAHLLLQRVLYRINRLKFFWYDDLSRYKNEDSEYLRAIQNRIESTWARWELDQLAGESEETESVAESLRRRAGSDLAPMLSPDALYYRRQMGAAGYRRLLEIASLDGLVEASQLSRTLGGVANPIQAMMTRLLVEEYGGGRLNRKHSTYFLHMLDELGIESAPEAHFEIVPWQVLATINHSFLVSERKLLYLRYVGGLLYTEISVPAAFDSYRLAAERLGMSEKARGYWNLHINEDERHGQWMLNEVAIPLAERYPDHAREIVLGYDQQKFMSDRASRATLLAVKRADQVERIAPAHRALSIEVAA
jgi:hypothetical protein